MSFKSLFLMLLLSWSILCDVSLDTHADQLAAMYMGNTHELNCVQKKTRVMTPYSMSGNYWHTFADLFLEFDLPFPQPVFIKYQISAIMYRPRQFYTHLQIDGIQQPDFRSTSDQWRTTHLGVDSVFLSKGRHTLRVLYFIDGTVTFQPSWAENVAYLKVRYYTPGKPIDSSQNQPKKITKKVKADDDFFIINNKKWYQFQNLLQTIDIPFDQEASVKYVVITATNPSCQFATRLKIGGQINQSFNGLSWKNQMHQISIMGTVGLKKGTHLFQLEYKSGGLRDMELGKEYQTAYMEISYYQ